MVPRHPLRPRTGRCCRLPLASVDPRGAPPSSPHLLPRSRGEVAVALRPPAPSPTASAPARLSGGRPAPPLLDPSSLSAFICIFLPLFPAGGQSGRGTRRGGGTGRGEAGGTGRGSGSGSQCCGRRFQSGLEPPRARRALQPQPKPWAPHPQPGCGLALARP